MSQQGHQAFVKFFGQAANRSPRDRPVLDTVSGPNDIFVYGRGIARAYEEGRDDASPEDVALDPRKSIRQAAAIRLSEAGASWLGEELEARFREFGKLPGNKLDFD